MIASVKPKNLSQGKVLFCVLTHGATASYWLSKVLNAHHEVLCLHEFGASLFRHLSPQSRNKGWITKEEIFAYINALIDKSGGGGRGRIYGRRRCSWNSCKYLEANCKES